MKIIITGSLGHISKPLTEELILCGHAVTVISSKPDKIKNIEALGATAAIGSLDDFKFLSSAFAGADAVYAMVPPNYASSDQIGYYVGLAKNYAEAVRSAGVKRLVYLSSYGAHLEKGTGFIVGSYLSEQILNSLTGVDITYLRPGYFYYNLYAFVDMIKEQGIIGSNYGASDMIVMVHPKDIARVAAEELLKSGGEKVRYIASDERTANEIAHILGTTLGKPGLKWLTFTNEQMQQGLESKGLPAHMVEKLVELGASIHTGALIEDYEMNKPQALGKIKLEEFAKEYAARF